MVQNYTITINNNVNKTWSIFIQSDNPSQPDITTEVDKSSDLTINGLLGGNYSIRATTPGRPDVEGAFRLDAAYDPGVPVLQIY